MITVEARGEQCPIPVVKTLKVINEMKAADTIETHVDNETAVQNLTKLAESKNFKVKSEKIEEKHFVVTMEAAPAEGAAEDPVPVCIPDRKGNTVYAFSTNCMGLGSDELGATLMKGFIYAVSQLDELPKTMLFYNGGAKQGVEILTCGTCLNFYGLSDKLAVGEVTNMYTIVEKLNSAAHIVKP